MTAYQLEVVTDRPENPVSDTPVLFLHGALHGAWCWQDRFVPYFHDRGIETVTMSLRGHGSSAGPASIRSTRIADYVDDLRSVVDGLERKPVIVAHSMGGFVLQKYLQSLGSRGTEIPLGVLVSSVPPKGVIGFSLRMLRRHPARFAVAIGKVKLSPMFSTPELFRDAFLSDGVPIDEARHAQERCCEESFMAFLDLLAFDLPKPARVTTPIRVIGGTRDRAISAVESQGAARAYGGTAKIFDIAHDMMIEPNWREVADYVVAEYATAVGAEPRVAG